MSPDEREMLTDEDEMACAPESGQPFGGRANPWDDDDEPASGQAFPADHHEPPGNDL